MKKLINKLDIDNSKTHAQLSIIQDKFSDDYIEFYNGPEAKEPEAKEPEAKEPEAKEPEAKGPEGKENQKGTYKSIIKRADVFFADLSSTVGSEQGGVRPVVIIQNEIGNRFSPTITVAPITAQIQKAKLPTHVEIDSNEHGFDRDSVILLEQIRTIDKIRLMDKITHLDDDIMKKVDDAISIQLGLIEFLS